jgi:hypothetical protein
MRRKRHIHVIEHARLEHPDLAAAAFLGRSAQHHDSARQGVEDGIDGEPGAEIGDRDQVMSAPVPDFGQHVVLGEQANGRSVAGASFERRAKRRFDASDRTLDLKAVALKIVGEKLGGVALLVVQLRV